jgi:hypothetical protein
MRAILSPPSSRQIRQGTCVHVREYALDGLAQFGITDVIWDVEMADVFTGAGYWYVSLLVAFGCGQSGAVIVKYNAESHRRPLSGHASV